MKRFMAILMVLCMAMALSGIGVWAAEEEDWVQEPDMLFNMPNASAIVYKDSIYVFGGVYTGDSVQIFDFNTNQWRRGSSMPHVRMSSSDVNLINGKFYILGGNGADYSTIVKEVDIYDPQTDTWSSGADFPADLKYAWTSCAVGRKIYCFGGANSDGSYSTAVYIYDTISDTWKEAKNTAPFERYSAKSVAVGKDIYIIGGNIRNGSGSANNVFIYHTNNDTWATRNTTTGIQGSFHASVVGESIYLVYRSHGRSAQLYVYDISNDSMTPVKALPRGQSGCVPVTKNGRLYIIGCVSDESNAIKMYSLKVAEPTDIDAGQKLFVLLNAGEQVQLSTSYQLAGNADFTWSSENEAVATVNSLGKVTAAAVGEAYIYAESADGAFKDYIPVKVLENADEARMAVHLNAGEKAKLYLTEDASQVTWGSMDETIATVTVDGQVTGVAKGLAIVQGTFEGTTYQIYVRVNG